MINFAFCQMFLEFREQRLAIDIVIILREISMKLANPKLFKAVNYALIYFQVDTKRKTGLIKD